MVGMTRCFDEDKVQSDVQERETEPVVCTGFCENDVPHMQWDMLLRESTYIGKHRAMDVYSPLQIELASTGSVGVTQLPITRLSRKVRPGINKYIKLPHTNQAIVITGPTRIRRDRHSLRR